jgi:anti-sigma factor RsiW
VRRVECCEFRERYSDFADGLLSGPESARARRHLDGCAACRRFDAAFRTGVEQLRGLPPVPVSSGFRERLMRRLQHEVRAVAVRLPTAERWSGAVGALLFIATIGFVVWDVVESHAVGRADRSRAVEVAHAREAFPGIKTPVPGLRYDSLALQLNPFHPLRHAMVVADTQSVILSDQLRFDVPAVWGGR